MPIHAQKYKNWRFVLRKGAWVMDCGIAAAGGLGLRQSSAAFEVAGITQSGRGLPQSKAAAARAAGGLSAFHETAAG
jgi:hypothetical protein